MVDLRSVLCFGLSSLLCLVLLECGAVGQTQAELLSKFSERVALLSLRSSLGLKSKDWPIKGDPCTVWRGIKCDNGSVVGIDISGFKRTRIGKQYPQFAVDPLVNLTRLVYFNASRLSLPGTIPEWFGLRLLSLQVLDLSSCSVKGVIPVTLGNLTGLRTLNLSDNRLTGAVPSSLGQLSNLSELDLSGNSLTGPLPLLFGSLQNLLHLDVSSNYFTGPIPPEVGMLSRLGYLNISNNSFSNSIPPQLGNLSNLVELDLSFNALSGPVPEDLRRMRNLQKMVISDNLLSGSLPANLFDAGSRLQALVLRINAFTGSLPDNYWSLPELRVLDISRNNFTGLLPNSSPGPNLPDAKLDISQNTFYGGLTPILRRFRTMDLSGNYFEGRVPDYVFDTNASLIGNCLQNEKAQKASEECASFYRAKGLAFDDFGRPNSTVFPGKQSSSGLSHRTKVILAAVAGGVGLILIFLVLLILVAICIRKRGGPAQRGNGVRPSPAAEEAPQPHGGGGAGAGGATARALDLSHLGNAFTYEQLLQITEQFKEANLIKHGHSGDLFHGFLENGIPVVIKRIDVSENKNEGYVSELEFFGKVGHHRLVPLLGHCLENESQKFLVYKYMRNGDLASSLYRKPDNDDDGLQSLDWITRLKIALGAAEGLSYLHHECSPPLVHRDVQASSILLDDKFEVRLGSLSEVCPQGDSQQQQSRISRFLRLPQSSDPSSSSAATGTCPHDVYCFGKVLLELVTGKLGISSGENAETKEYLEETLRNISTNEKEGMSKILDPSLMVDEDLLEEVWAMAIIAKSCLNPKPSRRPLMRHILNALENPLKVVREENSDSSSRLRANSSRGSWNAAIFGSWRQSSSDVMAAGGKGEGGGTASGRGLKKSSGSEEGSGQNETTTSSSRRRNSNEIVPEPSPYIE
ncbi:PREDICTED: probable LRR receptor-like serine/threonine-protein kinase At2g16250 [Tarenaya hassleriana]|uniref:probable LRR receptor-like serine/threonine-protein kinase At2g16250 n=1 Tax=Tarenaya hassleriana TaxID=28532 RepID=UPI00053C4082|nr:PREDICTED: probable LRR receptor-like serine/threonine-protein kinase At2g16250 [Tarenaya hassleriana]